MGHMYYIPRLVGQGKNWAFLLLLTHGCVGWDCIELTHLDGHHNLIQPVVSHLHLYYQANCNVHYFLKPLVRRKISSSLRRHKEQEQNCTVCSAGQATLQGLWTTPEIVCHRLCSG